MIPLYLSPRGLFGKGAAGTNSALVISKLAAGILKPVSRAQESEVCA
jgi:hypothetical protein